MNEPSGDTVLVAPDRRFLMEQAVEVCGWYEAELPYGGPSGAYCAARRAACDAP